MGTLKKPEGDIEDLKVREHIKFLQAESQGNPLELSAVPTAAAPLLLDNQEGIYSNVLYKRKGNIIQVITPGSVITIT